MSENSQRSPLAIRGVHLDCRAQMLRFERILEIFEDLARWGFNTVLFEYEDRFPYSGRLRTLRAEDALTKEQVSELNRLADSLGLQIIPLVQCLGHLQYVLQFPEFRSLADGQSTSGWPATACPSDSGSPELFRQMATQVLGLHEHCRYFHMGGDEARLDPSCDRCAPRLREAGLSRLLVDYYLECADWLRTQGPEPIMWSDMPLRHPEALELLRGHATIMDWDYWSGIDPTENHPRVWGVPREDRGNPEDWPKAHRDLFARYVFTDDGTRGRPFPYTPFLRDHGFEVIVASAVRSSGDSFCAPRALHIENVIGAARVAAETGVLGSVITSWAVRRSPWPLTEYGLIAGAMTMNDPQVPREQIDAAFAKEHFGVDDPELAKIAILVGTPVPGLVDSLPQFDGGAGGWIGADYSVRRGTVLRHREGYPTHLATLRAALERAETLLAKASPATARQRARVALWNWAINVLKHFVEFGPELLKEPGEHEAARLKQFRDAAGKLAAQTQKALEKLYTERTMHHEQQIRFGVHIDYLDAMIEAAKSRPS